MKPNPSWQWLLNGTCIAALILPGNVRVVAAEPGPVRDIALATDGALQGTLTTQAGHADVNQQVVLLQGQRVVASARTDATGRFLMRSIRPGLYEVATRKTSAVLRVWESRSAPPSAQPLAQLVQGPTIVRAQDWSPMRRGLILGGVIITSGVIGGVIGYNIKDDSAS